MPRFVILEHTGTASYKPGRHWDLMLECAGHLRTWELEAVLSEGTTVRAIALVDHRLHYLDYEGPLTGNRGTVGRYDVGEYQVDSDGDGHLHVELRGERLQGRLRLEADPLETGAWAATFMS